MMICPHCESPEQAKNGSTPGGAQRFLCRGCGKRYTENTAAHREDGFTAETMPDEIAPAEELLERRRKEYDRVQRAYEARKLIGVKVNMDGPIGILHFGDPHVDDPGTDIRAIERDCKLVRDTDGLFGANVGDLHNNWVGRLGRLYGEQSTSAAEAWVLVEWLVKQVDWLYLISGNHDCWSGAGDPLKWITRHTSGACENWGARLGLRFPNGREIRVNARHDFKGHSQWNNAHGPSKAAQMGWRDQILTCGHKHCSGYAILKCPQSGLISHAIRIASYKIHDRYARELGLPDQNVSPSVLTIIDPSKADNDPAQVQVFWDAELGADVLRFMRRKSAA